MMKDRMIERIKMSAKQQLTNIERAVEHANKMNDYNSAVLAEAVLAFGCAITDTLNSIALILCEMLPKEE